MGMPDIDEINHRVAAMDVTVRLPSAQDYFKNAGEFAGWLNGHLTDALRDQGVLDADEEVLVIWRSENGQLALFDKGVAYGTFPPPHA